MRNGWLYFSRLKAQFQRSLELGCGALGIIAYDMLAVNEEEFKMI